MPFESLSNQSELLARARSVLMIPHSRDEASVFAESFHNCKLAFHQFDPKRITDDWAKKHYDTITSAMNTSGVTDSTGEGLWIHRIRAMSFDELWAFSKAVDELATWFEGQASQE